MLHYSQSTGKLTSNNGFVLGTGYAGALGFKNDPNAQSIHDKGPLPRGVYDVGPPHNTVGHGPFVLTLIPHPDNIMFGRGGFLIHGDSIEHPGTASKGCIIMPRSARELAWDDCLVNDTTLEVIL